jgi:hypothetical protein
MKITKALFSSIINNQNPAIITALDRATCGCGYCFHWVFQMSMGKFNPLQNEMDAELKDVKTAEDLYSFVKRKTDDIQGQQQAQV